MKKSVVALVSSLLVLGTVLAGCGQSNSAPPANSTDQNQNQSAETPKGEQVLRMNLHAEPPTADPGLSEDNISGAVIRAVFDGLTRLDKNAKPIEGVAEKIDISDDKLTYTFHLRDSKWSNGDPVTAHDFEFAWKRVLDPATAAPYAYQLYYVKGAEAYSKGKGSRDDVGVKALDDKTLQVTLEHPTPYFLELTAFYTYSPVPKKVVEANKNWANEASTIVGNGPFKMESWDHKNQMTLVKNDSYWDKDAVKLDKIKFSMIEDENTELSMFQQGDFDWAGKPLSSLPTDSIPHLKDEGILQSVPLAAVYWYKFNTEKPPFNNAKIRKAFAYAINRQEIIDNITQTGEVPATGAVPTTMTIKPDGYFKDNDAATAKKLLDEGMSELGITKLPPITLSYNTNEAHQKIAQAVQDQWKKNLDVDVTIQNQEWKVYISTLHSGDYQIGRMGWLGDFNDPINFLELFKEKDNGTNDTNWENPKYKDLLNKALVEPDTEKRKQLLIDAEQILMDEMPIAPVYFQTDAWVQNPKLKDVTVDVLGNIDFKNAYFEN
ncbi:peptide ABC transporter substrate-binding protein [Brevibacillus sp. B_LB10_24]|uniref:peptide ABC transporter substrate-binding protein n=1 Tax=Brevibacillus sp. B_LB10_24 TaxID=3380645 RepID=UPI0038B7B5D6